VSRCSQRSQDFSERIAGTAALGSLSAGTATSSHNLSDHPFLDKARAAAKKANQVAGTDLRFMVLGHTHQARIAVRDDADGFFVLVDGGLERERTRRHRRALSESANHGLVGERISDLSAG
jgi:hypothetical protein